MCAYVLQVVYYEFKEIFHYSEIQKSNSVLKGNKVDSFHKI